MRLFGFCLLCVLLGATLDVRQDISLLVVPAMFVYWVVFGLGES